MYEELDYNHAVGFFLEKTKLSNNSNILQSDSFLLLNSYL